MSDYVWEEIAAEWDKGEYMRIVEDIRKRHKELSGRVEKILEIKLEFKGLSATDLCSVDD